MTDPIRAALEKASAVYCYADGECPCATPDDCRMKLRSDVPAKIIAAFLRTLHDNGTTAIAEGNLPWLADYVLASTELSTEIEKCLGEIRRMRGETQ
jgi:hypothetical protein